MEILVGILAAILLLYCWLIGNWFARVLMTIALTVPFALVIASTVGAHVTDPAALVFVLSTGGLAAWCVASLPMRYWQKQQRLWLSQS